MIVEVDDNGLKLPTESVFPKMSRTPGKIKHLGKEMGADNKEIFTDRLGMNEEEIINLKKEGVI